MNKNLLGHFIMESLKYFFNFDPAFCKHAFLIALLIPDLCRSFVAGITAYFYDGALTVKEDALTMKEMITTFKERWENSEMHAVLVNNVRTLVNNFPDKNFRTWR